MCVWVYVFVCPNSTGPFTLTVPFSRAEMDCPKKKPDILVADSFSVQLVFAPPTNGYCKYVVSLCLCEREGERERVRETERE